MIPSKGHFADLAGVGGAPCLDLANTISSQGHRDEFDRLDGYADLVTWAATTGAIDDWVCERLRTVSERDPDLAAACYAQAVTLRDAFYPVALSLIDSDPTERDLTALSDSLFPILGRSRFESAGLAPSKLVIRSGMSDFDTPSWIAAWSAFRLLSGEEAGKLRQCENDMCTWLFLDRSRNGSRRWCSMSQCGAVVKARRYRSRRRKSTDRGNVP